MKLRGDKQLFKFYLRISAVYLLFWVMVDLGMVPGAFWPRFFNNVWLTIFIGITDYIFLEYTLPVLRKKRRYLISGILRYALAIWVLMMWFSFGLFAWRGFGIELHIYTALKEFKSVKDGAGYVVPQGILSIIVFGLAKQRYNYVKLKYTAHRLLAEKREAELNYLRSQTNPHFLFNTLNNIYSLSRDKSDLAPESILRLSKMLRYMLYETGGEYVAIEHEVKIISDYIELEKLRYDESLRINFNYDIEDMKQALPPLLLIPLVENAFKHGISETRDNPFADIHLSVNKRQLAFVVKNSTDIAPEQSPVKENIGLSNLRRQLELLYTDYSLNVQQGEVSFTATLKINLGSHV
jgi:sensor histidine kinase YesM